MALSPLVYKFKINNGGLYNISVRCARQAQGERNDVSNDCYIRVEGDYGTGNNVGENHGDDAPLSAMQTDHKYYISSSEKDMTFTWSYGSRLDLEGPRNKRVAIYNFKAGETYKLVVSGRSKFFKIDRIVFTKPESMNTAHDLQTAESKVAGETPVKPIEKAAVGDKNQPPAGRIAIVADGNSPDPDDIAATAVMLGVLSKSGYGDRLVHLSHSCDLDRAKRMPEADELRRQKVLHQLCAEGIAHWGPFANLKNFYNCRTSQAEAVSDLRDAINESSEKDPLWFVLAGEPDILGYALEAAQPDKRQYVQVISHHDANENSGDFFEWETILDFGIKLHRISNQNKNLRTEMSPWDWAKNHKNTGIDWIWKQMKYAEQDPVFKGARNHFDCSDAGMLLWWLTGATEGGNQQASPADLKKILQKNTGK